jgi:nucleoside-diphosphate-sugar epimerase
MNAIGNDVSIVTGKWVGARILQASTSEVYGDLEIRLQTDAYDPKQRQPDIALAKKALAWSPKAPLDGGLKETIARFRKSVAH